jgi:hypothetical protein
MLITSGDRRLGVPISAFDACHCANLCPKYSTRKERNSPAIRIAAGVASYSSSPRHLFSNKSAEWVYSYTVMSTRLGKERDTKLRDLHGQKQ